MCALTRLLRPCAQENVLRHPEFLQGNATTSFIERNPALFTFSSQGSIRSSKLLQVGGRATPACLRFHPTCYVHLAHFL